MKKYLDPESLKDAKLKDLSVDVQSTIIGLLLLQQYCMEHKAKWKLVAVKAKKYIKKEMNLENLKDVDSYLKLVNIACRKDLL